MKKENYQSFMFLEDVKNLKRTFQNEDDFDEFLSLDLKIQNQHGQTPVRMILAQKNYQLTPNQIMQICEKSDINQHDNNQWNYLHQILSSNKLFNFNLTNTQIANLFQQTYQTLDYSLLHLHYPFHFQWIFYFNKKESLGFNNQQLIYSYEKTIHYLETSKQKEKSQLLQHNINKTFPEFTKTYLSYQQHKKLFLPLPNHHQKIKL